MFGFKLQDYKLSGAEIVALLLRGHVVRRKAWVEGVYIRITNEDGFDIDGKAIIGKTAIYTHGTHGYFLHLGWSPQPLKEPKVFISQGQTLIAMRSSEGLNMLLADDWEDYGFMSSQDFNEITENNKDFVRKLIKESNDSAKEQYKCQQ